jgi:hypothetical protein
MENADLLFESSHSSSVLELLQVVLSSGTAVLAVGDDLDSALGGRGQVHLQDLVADGTGKLQERKRCTRLDDNGLKTIVKHVRSNKLKLLGCDQLDDLARPEAKAFHRSQSLFYRAHARGRQRKGGKRNE